MKHLFFFFAVLALLGGPLAGQTTLNPIPSRVLGQLPPQDGEPIQPKGTPPNMLEGRELFQPLSVAVDSGTTPPILYVADTTNNRVLGWRNSWDYLEGRQADIVLGQEDRQSSFAHSGPRLPFFSGLSVPVGVAVDSNGNVFVIDSANNRILRFPGSTLRGGAVTAAADMIIGQNSRTAAAPNRTGAATPARNTLRTVVSGSAMLASLAFDPGGNLWVTDAGNHRVLRFARGDVSSGGNIGAGGAVEPDIAADLVLGQDNFETATTVAGTGATRSDKKKMRFPGAITVDSSGAVYVADDMARVLYFTPPSANGQSAARILGLIFVGAGETPPPQVNDISFGYTSSGAVFTGGPRGLFTIDNRLYVSDTYNNRIVSFAQPADWPAEATLFSPRAAAVYGQYDFQSGRPNRWTTWEPTGNSLHTPGGAVFAAGRVWVADSGNNRVLILPNFRESGMRTWALSVAGQLDFVYRAPNLIEGREFASGTINFLTGTLTAGPAHAIDLRSPTPHLYVADTGNNRVLGFRDARTFKAGDAADIVIGQVDMLRGLVNSPYNDAASPTPTGLSTPSGVAVDADGNLWVADSGNGRVLKFHRPFDNPERFHRSADLVIGQPNLSAKPSTEVSQSTLSRPVALAFTGQGQLVVADAAHNRVLRYDPPFGNGMSAGVVVGQSDFVSSGAGNGSNQFSVPVALALDTDDRLYVADLSNRRVQIFHRISGPTQNGVNAAFSLFPSSGTMQPVGLTVSEHTGEIFVSDAINSVVRKFPNYLTLLGSSTIVSSNMSSYGPRALALDARDNLYVFDAGSRIVVHYPSFLSANAGSGFLRLTPGMVATIDFAGRPITDTPATASGSPLPTSLGGVTLTVDGVPAPLMSVTANSVKYVIPWSAPTTGAAEFVLRRSESGELLATQWQNMDVASPGFLLASGAGAGAIRVKNQDGSDNSSSNPAARGSQVTLYLTGFGPFDGHPPDGQAADVSLPTGDTQVLFGIRQATILSSSLDPNEPGVWRLRVQLPQEVAGVSPSFAFSPVVVAHKGIPTNRNPVTNAVIINTVAIRP